MAGQQFQYDEKGTTFSYFLLSFLALLLIPCTYWFWPKKEKPADPAIRNKKCGCENCHKKDYILRNKDPWKKLRQKFIKSVIIFGWLLVFIIIYRIAQFDYEYANFDPYEILKINLGASQSEIKRAYHKLSLVYHPDKETGDEKKFMKLTKAYEALTDEIAKRNWELYGNPDGPGAMSFGIALPSWIVEKENSILVLGLYTLVFMVALPTIVGIWWYQSIRYSGEHVLLDTTQLYYYFFHKTQDMNMKRVIMILSASLEFERGHNREVVERPSDNVEVPQLIKHLPYLGEHNKEKPLCFAYSLKARALIHAHLSRIPLPLATLDCDRMFILGKAPALIQEMVTCVYQLMILAHAGRISRIPSLHTLENCMILCPMLVQALWNNKSSLLQLPYVTEDIVRYIINKKRNVRTISQFVRLPAEQRRSLLKDLSDDQYDNVMKVCAEMPNITVEARAEGKIDNNPMSLLKFKVLDDEDPSIITAGSVVTITCLVKRDRLGTLFGQEAEVKDSDEVNREVFVEQPKKVHMWNKSKKKGRTTKKSSKKNWVLKGSSHKRGGGDANSNLPEKSEETNKQADVSDHSNSSGEESDISDASAQNDSGHNSTSKEQLGSADDDDDDVEWTKVQNRLNRRERVLEGRSKFSHPVHCPLFSEEKQEYWWIYVRDRKLPRLITAPILITDLIDEQEVQLKLSAQLPGVYHYVVIVRSDSYLDVDVACDLKLDVQEAKEVPIVHPQWEISDDEKDEIGEESDFSDLATDEDEMVIE